MYCSGMLQACTSRLNGNDAQNGQAMIACSW